MFLKVAACLLTVFVSAFGQAPRGLHVTGNRIVDGNGKVVPIHGANRSGGEYSCIQGFGIWDGPGNGTAADLTAMTQLMVTWHINAVRVALNEDCWLGVETSKISSGRYKRPALNPAYYGVPYKAAVDQYVGILNNYGLIAILEDHWAGPKGVRAYGQAPMPDADYTPSFWKDVVTHYANNSSVIFNLFNEPAPFFNDPNWTGGAYAPMWNCWKNGGNGTKGSHSPCDNFEQGYQLTLANGSNVQFPAYTAAGMTSLVSSIRAQEATSHSVTHVIALDGVDYADSIERWLEYRPSDANLVATWHPYSFTICGSDTTCWYGPVSDGGDPVQTVMQSVPMMAGEFGEDDCGRGYDDTLLGFLDTNKGNYNVWTWNAWYPSSCSPGDISVIQDDNGTPFPNMGTGYLAHQNACTAGNGSWICQQ